jgi:hypothetical protein
MLETKRQYRIKNRDKLAEKQRDFSARNPEYDKEYYIRYRSIPENADKLRIRNRNRMRKYYKENPKFKARIACRNALKRVMRAGAQNKSCKTEKLLGYTFNDFKKHIEMQFSAWMNWENYGKWHIDHVKPVAVFISEGVTDPKIINALTNLQPLEAGENIKKGARYVQFDSLGN